MSEQPDAGTAAGDPAGTDAGTGGGTAGNAAAGGEQGTVDAKLAMTWKGNLEKERAERKRLEAELESMRERRSAPQQPQGAVHPGVAAMSRIRESAASDPLAADTYTALNGVLEGMVGVNSNAQLTEAMVKAHVPAEHWDGVKRRIAESGYSMTVEEAMRLVAPPEPDAALRAELDTLKKKLETLERRPANGPPWAGGGGGGPAPPGTETMPKAEYLARIKSGDVGLRTKMDAGLIRLT